MKLTTEQAIMAAAAADTDSDIDDIMAGLLTVSWLVVEGPEPDPEDTDLDYESVRREEEAYASWLAWLDSPASQDPHDPWGEDPDYVVRNTDDDRHGVPS